MARGAHAHTPRVFITAGIATAPRYAFLFAFFGGCTGVEGNEAPFSVSMMLRRCLRIFRRPRPAQGLHL